jgi:hypothetical protein
VLLLFGRLGAYKGGAELLDALVAAGPDGPHLLVAGKQVEPLGPRLDRLPTQCGGPDRGAGRLRARGEVETLFHARRRGRPPLHAILTSGAACWRLSARTAGDRPALPSLAELLDGRARTALSLPIPATADGLAARLRRFACPRPGRLDEMQAAAPGTAAERHDRRQGGAAARRAHAPVGAAAATDWVPRSPTAEGGAG